MSATSRVAALFFTLVAAPSLFADDKPLRQSIDDEIRAAWKREKIDPAARADDATFLRRVYLDLLGIVPTYDETKKFLDDNDKDKRSKLIDKLLAEPRFSLNQADVWDQILFGRHPAGGDATRKRDDFKKWLAGKFATNQPYDRLVNDILLAEQDGSEMFYVQFRNQPEEATVAVTRIFLGTQLQCARCHDHPFDSWTQRDFYGMAGFFVRLVVADGAGSGPMKKYKIGEKSTGEVLFSGSAKDQKPGKKGDPVKPKFLGGAELDEPAPKQAKEPEPKGGLPPKPEFSRKSKLAEWVVSPSNPWFARAAVNRVWAQFMGRGIVHPVDDLGEKNKPSHPALLDEMAKQFAAHKYDLKWLIREIANSETYQLSLKGKSTEALPQWFERARVRPLTAEEILASVRVTTGFDNGDPSKKLGNATEEYVLRYFGEPTNGLGDFQGSLSEHLFLNNSEQLRQFIRRKKGNLADTIVSSTEPWEKRVDRMFLTVLSRMPRDVERTKFVDYIKADAAKPEARVEEAIWVLLNSSEFRFNH